jgi:hypothetical protein
VVCWMRTLGYRPSSQVSSEGKGKVWDSVSDSEKGYRQMGSPWAGECRKQRDYGVYLVLW